MTRSLWQIFASIMALVFVLIVPYFVGKTLVSDRLNATPEITKEAGVSSEVLGIEDTRLNTNSTFSLPPYETIFFGVIGLLAIITMVSQVLNKNSNTTI